MTLNFGINLESLPGPEDITRVELENGIVILTRQSETSSSVSLDGYIRSGSIFDPDEKLGLAHFLSLALMRGTQNRDFQQIYSDLESIGASLGFGSSVHTTRFGGRALSEDLSTLLHLLSDAIRTPVFPPDHISKLRAQFLTSLAIRAQDTGQMASLEFDRHLYGNHPYAFPEDGTIDTIQNITREDLFKAHREQYGPKGMVLVIVGAMPAKQVIAEVEKVFGDWKNPDQVSERSVDNIQPISDRIRKHVSIPGKVQADIVMGTFGPNRQSPDFIAASLGNNVLGQFGMMGRIGTVVREKAGLAYYASTSLNPAVLSGSWEVSAGVNPANLQRAIDLIESEIERFVKEPVSKEELSDSQAHYIGRMPLLLESNHGVASGLVRIEQHQLGLDYYRRYPAMVSEVTPDKILEVARKYFDPQNLVVISAGPDAENL
jgi:zinc protease